MHVGSLHPCLKYYYELKNDDVDVTPLDKRIKNLEEKLFSSLTGLILNYHSLPPLKYKRLVV